MTGKDHSILNIIWLMLLILAGVRPNLLSAGSGPISVQVQPELKETRYCHERTGCILCWTTYQSEVNKTVISNRSACSYPLIEQQSDLALLLTKILADDPAGPHLQTLFWGRLISDNTPISMEMSLRLSLAAYQSRNWDSRRGKPRGSREITAFVRQTANEGVIYPELKAVFNKAGKDLSIASVEKVLVRAAGELPFFEQLKAYGIRENDLLPYDCLTWFDIRTLR